MNLNDLREGINKMNDAIKKIVRKVVPLTLRNSFRNIQSFIWIKSQMYFGYIKQKNAFLNCDSDTIFLIGVPEHGNLGDQAIGYTEKVFLSKLLEDRNICYITEYGFYSKYFRLKKFLDKNPNSEILWHGGGNVGDIYKFHETMRLFAIKHLPHVKITILPQTIDYTKCSNKLQYAKEVYNNHSKLTFFVREKESYKKACLFFPKCKVFMVPDIVVTYQPRIDDKKRKSVLICTRNDIEKNQESKQYIDSLKNILESNKIKYKITDTVDEERYSCKFEQQKEGLYKKWGQFASSEVVITDRLHGMIFSLITHTPCIALDNSTGKVSSFYHTWLENSKVLLLEKPEDIEKALDFIKNSSDKVTNIDDLHFDVAFEPLIKSILKLC